MKESTIFTDTEQVIPTYALSVDVERSYSSSPELFEESLENLLMLLSQRKWKATLFVEGEAAAAHPGMLRTLHDQGHEIGSHGFRHEDQRKWSRETLKRDLEKSLEIFARESVPCAGYRAPFFLRHPSLDEILLQCGIPWDSSVSRIYFPGRYDHRNAPSSVYQRPSGLWEIPIGRINSFLPFSLEHMKGLGRFYPRELPATPSVFYGHSYSFANGYPAPWFNRRHNLNRTQDVLDRVLGGAHVVHCGHLLTQEDASQGVQDT